MLGDDCLNLDMKVAPEYASPPLTAKAQEDLWDGFERAQKKRPTVLGIPSETWEAAEAFYKRAGIEGGPARSHCHRVFVRGGYLVMELREPRATVIAPARFKATLDGFAARYPDQVLAYTVPKVKARAARVQDEL